MLQYCKFTLVAITFTRESPVWKCTRGTSMKYLYMSREVPACVHESFSSIGSFILHLANIVLVSNDLF